MSAAQDTITSLRDDGSEIIAVVATMLSLAIFSVLLRLVAKSQSEKEFGSDDVLIGCALASYLASESLVIRAIQVGSQAIDGKSPEYSTFLRLTWAYSFLYWFSIAFATLSVLFLYRRVFSTHRFFSTSSLILIILTVIWWVSGSICDAVSYYPAQSYWDSSILGHYILNYQPFWLTSMVAELVIEALVLALPIRGIAGLNLSTRKKVPIIGMFCMGGFVLITGIVRIYYSWNKADMTPGTIWLSVHSSVAIISACLPTYRPLLARMPVKLMTSRHGTYTSNHSPSSGKASSKLSNFTKRTTPTTTLNTSLSQKELRTSFDTHFLSNPPASHPRDESESTIVDDAEKGLELHEIEAPQNLNGLTKKISIPSPSTESAGEWTKLGIGQDESHILKEWPLVSEGPMTRRAEFEL